MSRVSDLDFLVRRLILERFNPSKLDEMMKQAGGTETGLFTMFRALVNTRPAGPAGREFCKVQDRVLKGMILTKGITKAWELEQTEEGFSVWRGDITTLEADAIVNAANDRMLGCWQPGHYCIDNAIHTFAGVQLREECNRLMEEQGHLEPTGSAKATPAYNLPAKHVIHTVGPVCSSAPSEMQIEQLKSCYISCLDVALELGCESIAFCCISTGAFAFPQREAAFVAIFAVREWMQAHPEASIHVIFDVYLEEDEKIYREALGL